MSPTRRWIVIAVAAVSAVATYFLLPRSVEELPRRAAAIFVVAVFFWASEVIPLYATSLCVIGMQILFLAGKGGMAEKLPGLEPLDPATLPNYSVFLNPFASGIIILFMGGFLLSAAVTKHGLDQKIAAKLIRPFAQRPIMLVFAVMFITAFFSMWMSNTATAVMMLAIIMPLLRKLPEGEPYQYALVLAVPFGANIGGIGTPIGSPPNAVAVAALRQQLPELEVGFLDWMVMALPLAGLLMLAAGAVLVLLYRPSRGLELPVIEPSTEAVTKRGRWTLIVLGFAIFLWVGSEPLGIGLSSAAVALLAAAALTALGVLEKRDVDSIDWNVLILMWGGLALGESMKVTGLIDLIAAMPIGQLQGFSLALIVVVLAVLMSTFMSNTATANVLIPMVIAVALGGSGETHTLQATAVQLVLLTALGCSFAMAFPVSTPPNAIAFATGRIPAAKLMQAGGVMSAVCVVVLLLGYRFVLPLVLGIDP